MFSAYGSSPMHLPAHRLAALRVRRAPRARRRRVHRATGAAGDGRELRSDPVLTGRRRITSRRERAPGPRLHLYRPIPHHCRERAPRLQRRVDHRQRSVWASRSRRLSTSRWKASACQECRTDGFLNGIRVTRTGFRPLAPGHEYDHHLSDVLIEDVLGVELARSRRLCRRLRDRGHDLARHRHECREQRHLPRGGFEGEHVTATRPRQRLCRERTGGPVVRRSADTVPVLGTRPRRACRSTAPPTTSCSNNNFSGNAAGGIYLYTNCGEFVNTRPERYFQRRTKAEDNVIQGNTFVGGLNGVWVGSRMSDNTFPMDCSNTPYRTGPIEQRHARLRAQQHDPGQHVHRRRATGSASRTTERRSWTTPSAAPIPITTRS